MHRLGRHRSALVSHGTRFNSTVAEASTATPETTLPRNKRQGITLRWGTVIIPSREEILRIPKAQLYSPDLSYLEKAPQNSLAGRLAKPKFQPQDISSITEKRKAERLAREQEAAKLTTSESTTKAKTPEIEPPDLAAITQKRLEKRLAREAKNANDLNETIRTVQDNTSKLTSLSSFFDSPGPLPLARSTEYPSTKRSDDELSPLALKRRHERRLREKNGNRDRRSSSRKIRQSTGSIESDDMGSKPVTAQNFDSVSPEELEAASPMVHGPEFNGPEPISETIDVFNNTFRVVQPAQVKLSEVLSYRLNSNLIDSFVGGDYSKYTSLSSASNLTSPNALTVMKTAELALSYQRDYPIPQRKRAIEIVKTLVSANLVQVTKERQATT